MSERQTVSAFDDAINNITARPRKGGTRAHLGDREWKVICEKLDAGVPCAAIYDALKAAGLVGGYAKNSFQIKAGWLWKGWRLARGGENE